MAAKGGRGKRSDVRRRASTDVPVPAMGDSITEGAPPPLPPPAQPRPCGVLMWRGDWGAEATTTSDKRTPFSVCQTEVI